MNCEENQDLCNFLSFLRGDHWKGSGQQTEKPGSRLQIHAVNGSGGFAGVGAADDILEGDHRPLALFLLRQ